MESKLKLYSKGIVARSKELNSNDIFVTPIEFTGAIDGEINSDVVDFIDTGTDANGNEYQIPVTTSNTVRAEWLNLGGSNRITAPDVVVGEEVLIYRYGSTDRYRWESIGYHPRRLETIINRISNNIDPSINVLNDDNSYWTKMSTHEQLIILKTVMNNKEAAEFKVYLNLAEGTAGIIDQKNNSFFIDGPNNIVELENADGTIVSLNKTILNLYSVDEINIETKTLTIKANTINTKAETLNADINNISIKGDSLNVEVTNVSYTSGNYSVSASFSIEGSSFTHNGINVGYNHKHIGGTAAMGNTDIVFSG